MSEERRAFFRIDDRVILNYRPLDAAQGTPDAPQDGRIADLREALVNLDSQGTMAINQIRQRVPELGEVLEIFNNKLNVLGRLATTDDAQWQFGARDVNLSASGLAFRSARPVEEGEALQLELILLPSYALLTPLGRVVDCRPADEGYTICLNFEALAAKDQDTLVQHVFRKHSEQLQRERGLDAAD